MALSTPSTPGVRAPLDASVMRAASASQVRSAISLRSRSNLRSGFFVDHVASLRCISDYQRSSPHCGQVIRHTRRSNCLPSPCGQLSRPRTTTRAPSTCTASRDTLPCHRSSVHAFPSSHAGLYTRARLPIAVFLLAFHKSSRTSWSSYALPMTSLLASVHVQPAFAVPVHTYDRHGSASCLESGVGRVTFQPSDACQ
jgi:hypothetical protein